MKIKLHSLYENLTFGQKPQYIEWSKDEGEFDCWSDFYVRDVNTPKEKSIALLIEPRSIQPLIYEHMGTHYNNFQYVFTHDSQLLNMADNARQILWGGVYEFNVMPKTKDISFASSDKLFCELHRKRMELAYSLENVIDCYGTYNGGSFVDTKTIYGPYKFSIVIENHIDDYWFSEKICNCFANKTIPIYYGARKINELFNSYGIIQVHEIDDIPEIIKKLDVNRFYTERVYAVDENYELVKQYVCFEDWFYLKYKNLLQEVARNGKY